jgi:hypothetical protein
MAEMDPRVEEFLARWGLPDPGIFIRQRIIEMMDAGELESNILKAIDAPREAIGQAIATDSLTSQGLQRFEPTGSHLGFRDFSAEQQLGDPGKLVNKPEPPPEGGGFVGQLMGFVDDFRERINEAASLTPFDRAFLELQAQFPDALITEAPDGRIQVSSGGDVLFFDALDNGQPLLVQKGLDSSQRGAGAGGFRPAGQQFAGVDPRTGRAIIFNPNTGRTELGDQVGFAGIDPEREFALDSAEQLRKGASTTAEITSSGRNFLAAAHLANTGRLPIGLPAATIDQATLLNSIGAGTTGPQAGFAPAPTTAAGTADPTGSVSAGAAGEAAPLVPQPAPVGNAGPGLVEPVTQEELAQLGRDTLADTRVGSVLRGEAVGNDKRFANFAVPTVASLESLSDEEQGALDTQLQNDPNLLLSLSELKQQQRRGFSAPARRARGFVRQV